MRHVKARMPRDRDPIEDNLVHYEGVGIIGSQTLCGHTDQVQWTWELTTKRVNCPGCIGTRNHVLGRQLT